MSETTQPRSVFWGLSAGLGVLTGFLIGIVIRSSLIYALETGALLPLFCLIVGPVAAIVASFGLLAVKIAHQDKGVPVRLVVGILFVIGAAIGLMTFVWLRGW